MTLKPKHWGLNVGLGKESLWPVHSKVAHSSLSTLPGVPYCGSGEAMSHENEHDTTLPRWGHLSLLSFTLLCFADTDFFFFKQSEGLWKPCIEQVCGHHFSNTTCSLCVSVSHFGGPHSISSLPLAKRLQLAEGSDDGTC